MLTDNYETELVKINEKIIDKKNELHQWFLQRASLLTEMLDGKLTTQEGDELLKLGDEVAAVVRKDLETLESQFHFYNYKLNLQMRSKDVV